jgi:hypothetical protein
MPQPSPPLQFNIHTLLLMFNHHTNHFADAPIPAVAVHSADVWSPQTHSNAHILTARGCLSAGKPQAPSANQSSRSAAAGSPSTGPPAASMIVLTASAESYRNPEPGCSILAPALDEIPEETDFEDDGLYRRVPPPQNWGLSYHL